MLIQRAVLLNGATVDIRAEDRITAVADELFPLPGEDVVDAAFGTVIPGLHDHHVHVRSAAAALGSVPVGPLAVRSRAELVNALAEAQVGGDGWIRAIGYHDSVAGLLDRTVLDAVSPLVPVRVQHRSGALWTVNSLGLDRLGMSQHPDGRLWRTDRDWMLTLPRRTPTLDRLSAQLTGWGVTGITDATPDQRIEDVESLAAACTSGELRQRLHCMAAPGITHVDGVTLGPAKVILDDSSLDLEWLERWIADCHRSGRAVAVHCVTDSQLVITIAAFRTAGVLPRDRIEHAAVVPRDCIDGIADLGVTVVTQPNFVAERGDAYLAEVPAAEHHQLWRVASLLSANVPVALSTDMPFGDGDPWAAMRAAVHRRTVSGAVLNEVECISARTALTMFFGHADNPAQAREIMPGQPGDLCVLKVPPVEVLRNLDAGMVTATIVGGKTCRW